MTWFEDERNDVPKRMVCANCKNDYNEGDKYCRFCGAPMGKPDFIEEDFSCIYGPPPTERVHKCSRCGYEWTTIEMVDKERYCPKCGGYAPADGASDLELFPWMDQII